MSASSSPRILQATARNRVVIAYAVPPAQVASLLPEGLVPVERDGAAYVSLVGVELTKLRVLGLLPPGFRRVPAVELRVHVRPAQAASSAEGTWTVQAHVPRRLVAWGAKFLYGEPVAVTSMQPIRREHADGVEVTYRYDWRGREQRLRIQGDPASDSSVPDALSSVLLHPSWRYTIPREGTLLRTRIDRPETPPHPVHEYHLTVRWDALYGSIGELAAHRDPALVLFSPGTPVTLRWRERV